MILNLLTELNLEPTRENYLAIDRGEPNPELTGKRKRNSRHSSGG